MLSLANRTCIIAGGTGDIASEAVKDLLKEGMNVILLSHFPEKCKQLIAETSSYKGKCLAYANSIPLEEVAQKVYDQFGSLDVFISKTGILNPPVPFEDIDSDKLANDFKRQVIDVMKNIKILLPYLKQSKAGRIVLFSTIGSLNGSNNENISDSIVKGALNSLVLSLSEPLAKFNITINVVAFSNFIQDHPGDGLDNSDQIPDIPLNRLGNASDFKGIVEYLVSEESGFMTGEIIRLAGGTGRSL
ncbi:MAG: SDR family oxidoreductase [Erysipelotrichaceae bacterium]|nr:SDR family oxidoreductase [Erysipelotrichaceae bacterium]